MKVLIVDDEKLERKGLKFLFQYFRYSIELEEAENGEKALRQFEKEPADIVITDIKMPFMDGLTFIEEIRKRNNHTKIVIVSAYDDFTFAQRAIPLHVSDYLLKPIDEYQFQSVMDRVLKNSEFDYLTCDNQSNTVHMRIAAAIDIIHTRYMEDISLEEIAEQTSLSASYLSHLFKKETGVSVVQYITKYRLEQAALLLNKTPLKVVEISKKVGFNHGTYFHQLFKHYYGITPTKFRETRT